MKEVAVNNKSEQPKVKEILCNSYNTCLVHQPTNNNKSFILASIWEDMNKYQVVLRNEIFIFYIEF